MAHDVGRIPAWRRLGLALKNEDQSGVTVSEHNASRSDSQHVTACGGQEDAQDSLQQPVEPAINGKSSKLGKRKHQTEPAEESDQTLKKTKTSCRDDDANELAGLQPSVTTNPDITELSPAPGHPKGDPNYRKKKAKPNKRSREHHDVAKADPTPSKVQSDLQRSAEPALSPDESVFTQANERPTLLASTETDHTDLTPTATLQRHLKKSRSSNKDTSGSPQQIDHRKSVAFTPDTKTTDGNTGQELFKQWVAGAKGSGPDSAPPEVSNFNLQAFIAKEEKAARKLGQLEKKQKTDETETSKADDIERKEVPTPKAAATAVEPTPTATAKGKKKDPLVYLAYLAQYYTDRDHWKFNKAKQNDVVDNALNVFRIPDEHSEALLEYVTGLKGAGVIQRLKGSCKAALKELDEQDAQNSISMDDLEARKAAQEEAQQERIAKEQKRRKVEGDVEGLLGHPHGDGYIRRLRRKRAEALLTALGRTAPILSTAQTNGINPMMQSLAPPPQRDSPRKRKRRGEVSSDESSSDSSNDEESPSSSSSSSSRSESESDDSEDSDSDSSSGSNARTSSSDRSSSEEPSSD